MSKVIRHFLDFDDLQRAEMDALLAAAQHNKQCRYDAVKNHAAQNDSASHSASHIHPMPLAGRFLVMLFERPSTRTRVSFAAAMAQSGGQAMVFDRDASQLARGESVADTARVMTRMADAVMIRARGHAFIEEFAAYASCPIINGLSDKSHPCQVLADVMTFLELRGSLQGRTVAWVGDCNNVLCSWVQAVRMFDAELRVACPPLYRAEDWAGVQYVDSPLAACADADLVMTDVWASMGDEHDGERRAAFAEYTVDDAAMQAAKDDAIFMHCLPAHRGEEVSATVIDGPQSAVWQQAENRLYAQQALLHFLLGVG